MPKFTVAWWPWESCRTHGIYKRLVRREAAVHWKIFPKCFLILWQLVTSLWNVFCWKLQTKRRFCFPYSSIIFPLAFCFCISFFSWWMSLRGNVLLRQNKRLGGLWTFVIRIIKPFSLIISLSSLLFHVLCFPMWPFLRESHQAFTSFSPFIPHKILLRILQCLPGGEEAWGEFEDFHVPVK